MNNLEIIKINNIEYQKYTYLNYLNINNEISNFIKNKNFYINCDKINQQIFRINTYPYFLFQETCNLFDNLVVLNINFDKNLVYFDKIYTMNSTYNYIQYIYDYIKINNIKNILICLKIKGILYKYPFINLNYEDIKNIFFIEKNLILNIKEVIVFKTNNYYELFINPDSLQFKYKLFIDFDISLLKYFIYFNKEILIRNENLNENFEQITNIEITDKILELKPTNLIYCVCINNEIEINNEIFEVTKILKICKTFELAKLYIETLNLISLNNKLYIKEDYIL